MKIVLASYFEEENHGSGRKIGISPGKPNNLPYECELKFDDFSPGEIYWDFHRNKKADYDSAAKTFIEGYKAQLDEFFKDAKEALKDSDKTIQELLGLKDDDTLLTWEKKGNTSYRDILAEYLKEAGFNVVEN